MENLFLNSGFNLDKEKLKKFEKYYELLIYYNNKFNITSITEKEDVYKKHFVDSLMGKKVNISGKVIDVGAGGGFPSLPLKIYDEDIKLTLIDSTLKKCEFLKTVKEELCLKDVEVINARAEDLAKNINYREKYDFAASRAVARLNVLCEYCMPFVKTGGKFVSYKAEAEEEIKESASAIEILGGRLEKKEEYDFYGAKRTLIVIDKIKNTPLKYPRGNGKERKNPL